MIKPYNGFKAEKRVSGERIPAGGYVAKIMGTNVEKYDWADVLIISFDIAEGNYKDFFAKQYRANTDPDKTWKGNFRINIPKETNRYYESDVNNFNNLIYSVEESNNGYHWDWDEAKFKGKTIGVLFRNKEFEKDGITGWFSDCCSVTDATSIREGKFKMPKDKPLANKSASAQAPSTSSAPNADFEEIGDEDLPF